jgi:4-amino-4-deoxy-L-arabinose transferase-like glycosyltransferase
MRLFFQRHLVLIAALAIFGLAFFTRTGALKQYVVPDEPSWVWRSLSFSQALAQGQWAGTAQIGHPGVTTMWLGSLGILVKRAADPVASSEAIQWLGRLTSLAPENAEAFKRLGVFLTYTRIPVIVINALGVVLIFLLMRRLFGLKVGLIAGLLFALDPFTAGLSGLLHVDGLLTTFSVLSVLAMLNGLTPQPPLRRWKNTSPERGSDVLLSPRNRSSSLGEGPGVRSWFALAGAFAGLAFLSKSPGIFLTAFAAFVLVVALIAKRVSFKQALFAFLSFVIVHWTLFILLYPAMWVDPLGTLGGIFGLASYLKDNAVRPTFFDGQFALNHGVSFYPLALAFRLTPVIVLGLLAAVGAALVAAWRKRQNRDELLAGFLLFAFTVLYLIFITPASKKYDRYMLPAAAMLIPIAAWGLGQIRSRVIQTIAVIGAALLVVINWPYLLMHYNLLLGGAGEAQNHFSVGWGEGLGAAANWINAQPDGLQSTAATTAVPSFAPIFSGQSRGTFERDLELSDYYVLTLSERQLLPDYSADLMQRGEIVQTLRTGLVDGAWVLRNKQAQQQADALRQADPQTDAIVTLIDLPVAKVYDGAAKLVVLPRAVTTDELEQTLNDLSTQYQRLWFIWLPTVSPVVQQHMQQWVDQTAELVEQQSFGGTQIVTYQLKPGQIGRLEPFRVQFNGNFALAGVTPVTQGRSGTIELRWQALAPFNAPYTATLQLIDQQGTVWSTLGGLIQDADQVAAAHWPIGQSTDQAFRFTLPDEAPPGRYDVRLSIDQLDGNRAGLFSASGNFSGTAPVLASFDAPVRADPLNNLNRATAYPFTHRWDDDIEIVGFDSGPGVTTNGNLWSVDVVWRSMSDHLPNLDAIWEVRDQANKKIFSTRLPLSAYPTAQWREGEVIGARYVLRFPADLEPADYHVSIGVVGPDGKSLEGGMFTPFDVRLLKLDRSFDQPQPQQPMNVTFDDPAITLIGADVPTQTFQAGETVPLNLYWQAGSTTSSLYTVFVHLETLNGHVIGGIDAQPQGGGMPTTSWATGQVIPDVYPVTIPADTPPGAYRLVVGLYDPQDGIHLIDTRTGAGQVVLEQPVVVK